MSDHIQTIVIGAGAVGLAIGRELARAGQECLILESTPKIGQGVSSRNSEVIHAGIYYPKGSNKASPPVLKIHTKTYKALEFDQ